MSTIGKVRAVFTASTSGLQSGVNTASASMKRMEAAVAGLKGRMTGLLAINGAQLFGSIASAAGRYAGQLAGLVASTTDAVSSQNDLAARLGVTYGELAGLSYAGALVGVSTEQIGGAMTKMQVAFTKAAGGSKQAQAAFAKLGLSAQQLNGMSTQEQFEAIAQSISQLPSEAERAAAAVAIFGRAGVGLLPMFQEGAAGIQRAREEAERFGLTLTGAQAGNVDEMGDAFDRAKMAVTGVIQQIVAYLAPAVSAVTTAFTDMIGSVGGANIGQTIGEGLLMGAQFLAGIADYMIANLSSVWEYASQIGGQWNSVVEFFNRAGAFLQGVFDSAKFIFGAVILGFGAVFESLATIAQQIGKFLRFDTSSIDAVVAGAQAFNAEISAGMTASAASAARNFDYATNGDPSRANDAGAAVAGPATRLIDDAIAQAREAASQVDTAKKQTVDVKQTVDPAPFVAEAVKGIDSRSREGVAEMFRIMRGDTGNVQEQQLEALQAIAANTAGSDFEEPDVELALP